MGLLLYNMLFATALLAGAPVWGWRMLRDGRYRQGLAQRLGAVPDSLRRWVAGRRVVWVHAVSVGEVLAAERLVHELGAALGLGWCVVVSTTTATGQRIAQDRFGTERVFFWPLDLNWIVRRYLRALQPALLVLLESELWPAMLGACQRTGVPVVVANARMSDRSFRRARQSAGLWRWIAAGVTIFLAQGEETANRLRSLRARDVRVLGNLKYDLAAARENALVKQIRPLLKGRKVIVAGSTLPTEEAALLDSYQTLAQIDRGLLLVLAPRHPDRFEEVASLLQVRHFRFARASGCKHGCPMKDISVILLDTLGDLASMYELADVAFVGGSLVQRGGHNPLEAARFGVPIVMGPSFENFREVAEGLREVGALQVANADELSGTLAELLRSGAASGERGREFFVSQSGATGRTVSALRELLHA